MKVTFDVNRLDRAVRASQEFQPSPESQGAGAFIRFLKTAGRNRPLKSGRTLLRILVVTRLTGSQHFGGGAT